MLTLVIIFNKEFNHVMLIIQEVLVSDAVVEEQFICNLSACKGACCIEGDSGAPLEKEELQILEEIYEEVKPYLTDLGRETIEKKGKYQYYTEAKEFGTILQPGGACAFVVIEENGITKCGIEKAYLDGKTDYKKPISCHLYPIRVEEKKEVGFYAMNYDQWDICSAACTLGKKEELPVYKFLKEAIVRKFGEEFYHELDAAAEFHKENK